MRIDTQQNVCGHRVGLRSGIRSRTRPQQTQSSGRCRRVQRGSTQGTGCLPEAEDAEEARCIASAMSCYCSSHAPHLPIEERRPDGVGEHLGGEPRHLRRGGMHGSDRRASRREEEGGRGSPARRRGRSGRWCGARASWRRGRPRGTAPTSSAPLRARQGAAC